MGAIPIGLQLYSIREDCANDLAGTLAAVAKMGYAGVEFAGYYDHSAEDIRRMLDDLGLKCCGAHLGLPTVMDDQLAATMDFNETIGNPYLVVPGLPEECRSSREAWLRTAGVFNEVAEKIGPRGFKTGYHNHVVEFTEMDGERPWDTFFGNTKPEVIMQIDTGNALHGGADPVPYLEKYPGRAITVHLKEFSATDDKALIGEGDVRWQDCFALCESTGGTEWYIVEQESYAHSPLECVDRCLKNLRGMGK